MNNLLTQTQSRGLIAPGGQIAQSVEQRTENPCVPSSILGLATIKRILINELRQTQLYTKINIFILINYYIQLMQTALF